MVISSLFCSSVPLIRRCHEDKAGGVGVRVGWGVWGGAAVGQPSLALGERKGEKKNGDKGVVGLLASLDSNLWQIQ